MSASGKVALVTGSGRKRVGNVIARSLADDGYAIALHYFSSAEAAAESVAEIETTGVSCQAFQADVSNEADVDHMFTTVRDRFGRLDVLVTTASLWESIPLEKLSAEDFRRDHDVNVLGTFLCARRAGLWMASQTEGGSIITIGDWAIQRPYLDHVAYFTSKGAIPTLTRTLAVELASRNPKVRVNCIHPGPVMFPSDTGEAERRELVESTLVKYADDPQAIAHAVKFLVANNFVTGICIPVDGGRTIYAGEATSRKRPI